MSYLNFPRIHFSGTYQASPSTINNAPNNYNPLVYPKPDELEKVELYWNPIGNGGMSFMDDCVITKVDYGPGNSTTDPSEDAIIGQSFRAIINKSFPLQSALVDLDPMQQNTSEIWGMTLEIGGDQQNLSGRFPATSFSGIWVQCQGDNFPKSSASGSAVFQGNIKNVNAAGDTSNSPFLKYFKDHPDSILSVNINTNAHNNVPDVYQFNDETFGTMLDQGVPQDVLNNMDLMKSLFMNYETVNNELQPKDAGDVPTLPFVRFMLSQLLSLQEFNAHIDTILNVTQEKDYNGSTEYNFLHGLVTGSVGYTPSSPESPTYFVPSRMMNPPSGSPCFYAPFSIDDQNSITINLGNSLPTNTPVAGDNILTESLGELWLASFPTSQEPEKIIQIPYMDEVPTTADNPYKWKDRKIENRFITQSAGIFSAQLKDDYNKTPLGLIGIINGETTTLLQEDATGRYLRADQFVYRMNPGVNTTSSFPRGSTNNVHVYACQWGNPIADGTGIEMTMMTPSEAQDYTVNTLGTSGTLGVENVSKPQDILTFTKTATTKNGVAVFDMSCIDPGNPRKFVDGQVYFLPYNFTDNPIQKDVNDLISVLVYNMQARPDAIDLLAKFGRLYKIMNFLTDEQKVEQLDLRNMIKTLIQTPQTELEHMPVTRDMSHAIRTKVVAWIDHLNNS